MLTSFDKELLNILQTKLPIASSPFAEIADRLDSDEKTVIDRLRYLKEHGYIRKIGAFFDSTSLGYVGTLVAAKVEPEHIEEVAQIINTYEGVTHNYERDGILNLWFTLMVPDIASQKRILSEIQGLKGVLKLINLPANKKYKVSVQFKL
ncbi:MAG: Lrp/AsnC family transcriptional regulator [Veillonellaceae bacterium]|jgi:DNA-binding Lrp family transcriptional regulator|nr:Lrp/AsnC family transcriptional regulator [Veillonellaceae bacterium]